MFAETGRNFGRELPELSSIRCHRPAIMFDSIRIVFVVINGATCQAGVSRFRVDCLPETFPIYTPHTKKKSDFSPQPRPIKVFSVRFEVRFENVAGQVAGK